MKDDGSVHVSFARPLRDFVCFDVCVYFFLIGWERAGMWLPSIVLYVFLFVKGFAKHITFACICFVWFLVLNTYTVRTSLGLTLSSAAATDAPYLDDLDDVGGETLLLLLLLSLWLLLLLLVRLPQVAVIVAMLIAFVVVVAIIIGVVAVTVARLAATARTVLPTLLTMLLLWLMFMWLLLAPAALFNKLLLKNS